MFAPGPNGTLIPKLAESASSNAKADVWTFRLRRGVTWHAGKDFTADDVVFTIKRSWGSEKNFFNATMATIVDFANVTKVDDHTVRLPLKLSAAEFPSVTAFPNLFVIQDGTTDFDRGIGTGPFRLESFKAGVSSTFEAFADYWREGQPYVDELVVDSSYQPEESLERLAGRRPRRGASDRARAGDGQRRQWSSRAGEPARSELHPDDRAGRQGRPA